MKKWIALVAAAVMLVIALMPQAGFTEDRATVQLARAIYALAREEAYDVKLAIGEVAMNRVESPWYPSTLGEVLDEQHRFPTGSRYDEASLAAAHEVIAGRRVLPASAVAFQSVSASDPRTDAPLATLGTYNFYPTDRTPL